MMGSAVAKYRRQRLQKRAQLTGRIGRIANLFRAAAVAHAGSSTGQDDGVLKGKEPRQGTTSSVSESSKVDTSNTTSQQGQKPRYSESAWAKPSSFHKVIADESDDIPTDSVDAQREARQVERRKLSREEASYGTPSANLDYETILEIEFDVTCILCHMVKNDVIHECRICGRCYHQLCLESGGYCQDENFAAALRQSDEDIGWSCCECESLGNLLSMEEMDGVMEKFDRYDTDGGKAHAISSHPLRNNHENSKMSWADFLSVERNEGSSEGTLRDKFLQYDTNNDGIVSWQDFVLVESLDILERQPQVQLLISVTPKEIERIKNCFRMKDFHSTGVISVAAAAEVYYEWLKSLGLEMSSEGRECQERMHNPANKRKLITWERFIRQRALSILSARPNAITISPYIRGHPVTGL
ncbi:PHD finger protein 24-like isoform X2 [Diadema setosum]|uniref:PHD finger protein 24-like isoform X2 n=1 Tax=Diadema setosum TaxID=31175 RepID=UPI003B3A4E62